MEKNKSSKVEAFIDSFEDLIEEKNVLSPEDRSSLQSQINTQEELTGGLVLLKDKAEAYKKRAEECAVKIKEWQTSKKTWETRSKSLMETLEGLIDKLGFKNKSIKADGVKLAVSTRTVLEVDEEWLLSLYDQFTQAVQAQLPAYIKVSLSVDKTELNAHIKKDNSLLINYPLQIHTKVCTSTTIK